MEYGEGAAADGGGKRKGLPRRAFLLGSLGLAFAVVAGKRAVDEGIGLGDVAEDPQGALERMIPKKRGKILLCENYDEDNPVFRIYDYEDTYPTKFDHEMVIADGGERREIDLSDTGRYKYMLIEVELTQESLSKLIECFESRFDDWSVVVQDESYPGGFRVIHPDYYNNYTIHVRHDDGSADTIKVGDHNWFEVSDIRKPFSIDTSNLSFDGSLVVCAG